MSAIEAPNASGSERSGPASSEPDARREGSLDAERAAGFSAGAASCAVKLPTFEGPLDLLLHLCRESEVDVTDLPIALISQQYLDYLELMRGTDIDIAAEYLLMAATLAHIKSRILLPVHEGEEEAEGEDPRAELARRLALFAAFRQAADELARRPLLGRDVFHPKPELAGIPEREAVLVVDLSALIEAMRRVLAALPEEQAAKAHAVARERYTIQDRMIAVMDALEAAESRSVLFEEVLGEGPPSRSRVVITLLAVLELTRMQVLQIYQHSDERGLASGPIRVRLAAEPEGERVLDASDLPLAGSISDVEPGDITHGN
jgi:segregation and condensation protein A